MARSRSSRARGSTAPSFLAVAVGLAVVLPPVAAIGAQATVPPVAGWPPVGLDAFRADPAVQTPPRFDWRDNNGNFMSPIEDQGHCGSCWAAAILGAMEAMVNITAGEPDRDLDLSEQYLLSCVDSPCDCNACESTVELLDALVSSPGVPLDVDFPYRQSDAVPCAGLGPGWQSRAPALTSWSLVAPDTESVKQKILDGPVVARFTVHQDYYGYSGGVYEHTWGTATGYHYTVLVGWNDAEQCWIARNSWGADWGEDSYGVTGRAGWFRIKYEASDVQAQSLIALEVALPESSSFDYVPPEQAGCACSARSGRPVAGWLLLLLGMCRLRRPQRRLAL